MTHAALSILSAFILVHIILQVRGREDTFHTLLHETSLVHIPFRPILCNKVAGDAAEKGKLTTSLMGLSGLHSSEGFSVHNSFSSAQSLQPEVSSRISHSPVKSSPKKHASLCFALPNNSDPHASLLLHFLQASHLHQL